MAHGTACVGGIGGIAWRCAYLPPRGGRDAVRCAAGCSSGWGGAFTGTCQPCPSLGVNTVFYIMSYGLTIVLLLITIRTQLGKGIEGGAGRT